MNDKQGVNSKKTESSQKPKTISGNDLTTPHPFKVKLTHSFLLLLLGVIIAFSVINIFKRHLFWNHFEIVNYSIHSSIEALGAIAAILMAFMPIKLLFDKTKPSYIFLTLGFLQMGLWDLFHSFDTFGNDFVFTHSVALLLGGAMFALFILPWKIKPEWTKKYIILTGILTLIVLTVISSGYQSILPEMFIDGKFSNTAKIINVVAGILFFLTAIKLFSIYISNKNLGVLILIFIAISSGIVGITFPFSEIWTDGWWLWHIIRLIAFLATLTYLLWRIQKVSADLNFAMDKLNRSYLAVTESEKKFKGLFDNDPSAILLADPNTGIIYDVNPAAERLMEMNRDELIGLHQSKLHPEDVMKEQIEKFQQLQNEINVTVESQILTKNGLRKHVEIMASMVEIENKPYILGIFHDISTLIKQQNQLKQSDEKSRAIINSLPGLFYQISPEGKFVQWNENFEKLSGYSTKEMEKISPLDLFEGEDKIRVGENIQKVYIDGQAAVEADFVSKDGTKRPFHFTGKMVTLDHNPFLIGMGLDVSERKKAMLELEESEKKFKSLIKSLSLPLCLVDNEGNITYSNDRFIRDIGYTLEDIPTLDDWWIKAYPDQKYRKWVLETWDKAVEKARLEERDIESLEYNVKCKNGDTRILVIAGITIKDGFLATFIDVTERKAAEIKLRESEEMFKNAFNNAAIGRAMADLNGNFIMVNNAFRNMLGYSEKEILKMAWPNITTPEFIDISFQKVNQLVEGKKEAYAIEQTMLHKNGGHIWVNLNVVLLKDSDGKPSAFVADIVDLSDTKQAQGERDKFFDLTIDLLCIAGTDGYFRRLSPSWYNTFGYTEEEFLSKPFLEFVHPEDVQPTLDAVSKLSAQNQVINFINRYRCKDGSYRWLSWVSTPQDDTIYAAAHDITDLKKAENELIKTNSELEKFNKLAVGRELSMIELKRKINKLSEELGREIVYDLNFTK